MFGILFMYTRKVRDVCLYEAIWWSIPIRYTRNKSSECMAMGKYLQNNNNVEMERKPFY